MTTRDLSGRYLDDDGATYELRQRGADLFGHGRGPAAAPSWSLVFAGTVAGELAVVRFSTLPGSELDAAGEVALRIDESGDQVAVEEGAASFPSARLERTRERAPLLPPRSARAQAVKGQPLAARLSWLESAGATGYRVERAADAGSGRPPASGFAAIGEPTALLEESDRLPGAGLYWYRVTALGGSDASEPCTPVPFLAVGER